MSDDKRPTKEEMNALIEEMMRGGWRLPRTRGEKAFTALGFIVVGGAWMFVILRAAGCFSHGG